ncbi:MAG: translation initiation factor IF-5A [Candidatus Pacearchaeota archaeon]|nr:translation initiation factor IF-5A [Candidatus Pacearchaeota archaeon]
MVLKLISAATAKSGTVILWEGVACTVKSSDHSKTGKHGHTKCRMEVVGIFDNKKRIGVIPGDEKLEVPLVEKKKAQVLGVSGDKVSVMDLESFETLELSFAEELRNQIEEGKQVEYWDIEGEKLIMRIL